MLIQNYTSRWGTSRLSALFKENVDKNCNFIEKGAFQFCYGSLVPKHTYELTDELIETYKKYTLISQGDIVLNGLNLNYDFVTQRVAFVEKAGIITSAYICLRPRATLNNKYYAYLFKALDFKKVFNGLGTGIRLTLSYKDLKNYDLPVPPRDEQDQIVRFLDWKVSSINRLINIKKKEIKEIKSLKKSLIDECVTHGLNPDVPMKDSGVKWLGQIPAHWNNTKINLLFSERKTKVSDKDYLPLSVAKIGVVPQLDTAVKTDAGDNRKLVRSGDFVINSRSDRKGSCGISNFDGSVSLINIVLTPREEMNRNFIHYLMRSNPFSEEFYRYGRGIVGDLWTTRYSEMKNILLPIPPISEQNRIANYIKEKEESFNRAINLLAQQVVCLIELKSRIISDAITGKIDVRDVKLPSFDMVEEDLDEENLENNDETEESGEVE